MKNILLILMLLTLISSAPVNKKGKWIIGSGSQLRIHGKTNVNTFTCAIPPYSRVDTLHYRIDSNRMMFEKNVMIIPISDFNCGNNMITKDLRRSVKADQHPDLYITFISVNKDAVDGYVIAKMEIQLAGVSRQIEVKFSFHESEDSIQLNGTREISFNDFGLVSPKHLMGIVKVQQQMSVEFTLFIQCIS